MGTSTREGEGGGIEVHTRVTLPREEGELREPQEGKEKKTTMRRVKIGKEEVKKYGLTVGCKGCTQADEGRAIEGHSEECRTRMEVEMAKDGNRKLIRMEERMGREGQQLMNQEGEREIKEEPARMRSQLRGEYGGEHR